MARRVPEHPKWITRGQNCFRIGSGSRTHKPIGNAKDFKSEAGRAGREGTGSWLWEGGGAINQASGPSINVSWAREGGGAIKQASSQSIKGLGAAGWELGKGVVLWHRELIVRAGQRTINQASGQSISAFWALHPVRVRVTNDRCNEHWWMMITWFSA